MNFLGAEQSIGCTKNVYWLQKVERKPQNHWQMFRCLQTMILHQTSAVTQLSLCPCVWVCVCVCVCVIHPEYLMCGIMRIWNPQVTWFRTPSLPLAALWLWLHFLTSWGLDLVICEKKVYRICSTKVLWRLKSHVKLVHVKASGGHVPHRKAVVTVTPGMLKTPCCSLTTICRSLGLMIKTSSPVGPWFPLDIGFVLNQSQRDRFCWPC